MAKYTSAGRLLSEVQKIERVFVGGEPAAYVHGYIPDLFGTAGRHWSMGLAAYARLVDEAKADVPYLIEARRGRYWEAIDYASSIIDPAKYGTQAQPFAKSVLTPLILERLESMDEALQGLGRAFEIEDIRAREVEASLNALIEEIEGSDPTNIDAFLLDRLRGLRDVLQDYILYGPEGVEAQIATTFGLLFMRNIPGLSTQAKARILKAQIVLKGVLDVMVYVLAAKDGIEWAGPLLLPGTS